MEVVKHRYCEDCTQHTQLNEEDCNSPCCSASVGSFVTVPIAPQLKRIVEDTGKWYAMQGRFRTRTSTGSSPSQMCDIYDGEEYKKYSTQGGFLSSESCKCIIHNEY